LKSAEVRELKKMEEKIIGDLMEEFPEIEMLLEYFSPDTAELIRKHPKRALVLYNKFKPVVDEFMAARGLGSGKKVDPYQY
ncbi:unnamed protein product, partial [marine sediment metagenome]